jgi:hypothetical protein
MNCGITMVPERKPVSATSAMRPSMMTEVSRIFTSLRVTLSLKMPPKAERSR